MGLVCLVDGFVGMFVLWLLDVLDCVGVVTFVWFYVALWVCGSVGFTRRMCLGLCVLLILFVLNF